MFVFPNTNEEILWSCQECAPIFPTSANIFQKGTLSEFLVILTLYIET